MLWHRCSDTSRSAHSKTYKYYANDSLQSKREYYQGGIIKIQRKHVSLFSLLTRSIRLIWIEYDNEVKWKL